MSQKPVRNKVNRRFLEVKKNLDASQSYLIFENDPGRSFETILDENLAIYNYLKKQELDWQKVWDQEEKREYLIVTTQPGNEDQNLAGLMGCPFPKEIVYYVYKANTP